MNTEREGRERAREEEDDGSERERVPAERFTSDEAREAIREINSASNSHTSTSAWCRQNRCT